MARTRIDMLLVARGMVPSREKARAAILAGEVAVDSRTVDKPGTLVDEDSDVKLAERPRFVSRGGDKLAGALAAFTVDVAGRRCIDVGASTGGFTDCLLQSGAATVTAIDVGYGQLAWSLRTDERVRVIERLNVRKADPLGLGAPFDIVVADVSFISLRTVLPHLKALMGKESDLLTLVKPQFEAGKANVGKRGVVRDPAVHVQVLESVRDAVMASDLLVRGMTFSPVRGPEGNIEFWLWAACSGTSADVDVEGIVRMAHESLGG